MNLSYNTRPLQYSELIKTNQFVDKCSIFGLGHRIVFSHTIMIFLKFLLVLTFQGFAQCADLPLCPRPLDWNIQEPRPEPRPHFPPYYEPIPQYHYSPCKENCRGNYEGFISIICSIVSCYFQGHPRTFRVLVSIQAFLKL